MTLTPAQISRLEVLEKKIEHGEETFIEVGRAVMEIRESKLYLRDYSTFEGYCQGRWGWGVKRASQLAKAAEFWGSQKLLADTGQFAQVPSTEREAREMMKGARLISVEPSDSPTEKPKGNLSSGIVNTGGSITITKPSGTASYRTDVVGSLTPAEVVRPHLLGMVQVSKMIHEMANQCLRLLSGTELASSHDFRSLANELLRLDKMLQPELPGMSEQFQKRDKGRGTLRECLDYFQEVKLEKRDAEWFYDKCEGCGWKNSGKAIIDWRATVRAWSKMDIFPSQKPAPADRRGFGSAAPNPMAEAEKEMRALARRAERL